MTSETNITSIPVFTEIPGLIIDKTGKIIALNSEFKKLITTATPQANFFELFDEQKVQILQKVFSEARKNEAAVRDRITIEKDSFPVEYEVEISLLRSENNIYYLINFFIVKKNVPAAEIKKIWIITEDLENIIQEKKVLSVINKIKLTFPFTFIEKAKIQKEINELEDYFWIKDTTGKLLLVNDTYAESLGSKAAQIENKNEQDFLPKQLYNLHRTIDSYIIDSTNTIILQGVSAPVIPGLNKNISLIEFPLCDLDNRVVAIIGFTKKEEIPFVQINRDITPSALKHIPAAATILDKENKIFAYSLELLRLLKLNENQPFDGKPIELLFEKGFIAQLDNFIDTSEVNNEHVFNYTFTEKSQFNAEVKLNKIYADNGEYFGREIIIIPKIEADVQLEAKAKLYETLIEHTSEPMFIYEIENLKFLEVNDSALKLYGYKRNEFLNMDLTDLYAPEDIQTLIESGDGKFKSDNYSGPWRQKKSDGSYLLIELNRTSIDFKGKHAHLNVVRDVTEIAEKKKHQQITEAAYENTSDPIFNTDKDGFIIEINETVAKKLGYSKKDLEMRPFISLLSDEDRARVNKNVFHSGMIKPIALDVEFKKPSGVFQKAVVIATPIKDYNGDIDSYSIIIKLIEEIIPVNNVKETQVDSLNKIDPPFLSNVFHEILTPINVILGFTQEIGESIEHPNEEQVEAMDIIKENQKLLLQIMDNAVEYSTLEQKIIKFRPEEIKFVDILNEIKENTRKTAESKKAEITYGKISSSLTLETDKQKFISLLSLFIKFAIQITKENTIFLSAVIYDENYCAVKIKDNLNSISPYLLKALNEILSDDENMSRRNYGFSRFSVKLAKKIIELLSARKATVMREGEPNEFALVFPLKFVITDSSKMEVETVTSPKNVKPKSGEKIEKEVSAASSSVITASGKIPEPDKRNVDLSKLACLYLEDQLDSQMLFKFQLKDLRSIEFAPSFESALPLLKTKKFDFIVMDINLQGEYNGLDALRIIQKMPGYKEIPIIASTAYLQPGARDSFIAAGFSEFISKPLFRDKLLEMLKKFFPVN
jgi:PAS domain S-box-containing protein